MDSKLKFGDPPPAKAGRSRGEVKYRDDADALRSRPGEWALMFEDTHRATGAAVNTGRYAASRPVGSFEATTRSHGKGRYAVWVRYVGENGEHK